MLGRCVLINKDLRMFSCTLPNIFNIVSEKPIVFSERIVLWKRWEDSKVALMRNRNALPLEEFMFGMKELCSAK